MVSEPSVFDPLKLCCTFLTEMQEDAQKIILQERVVTIERDGDSFVEKTVIGGMAYEMRSKLNEVLEWKDKEVDPVFHIKVSTVTSRYLEVEISS